MGEPLLRGHPLQEHRHVYPEDFRGDDPAAGRPDRHDPEHLLLTLQGRV